MKWLSKDFFFHFARLKSNMMIRSWRWPPSSHLIKGRKKNFPSHEKNRFPFYSHIRSRYFCALNGRTHEQQSQQKTTRNFSLSSCPSSIIYFILIHFCFSLRYSDLMENRFSPLSFFLWSNREKTFVLFFFVSTQLDSK